MKKHTMSFLFVGLLVAMLAITGCGGSKPADPDVQTETPAEEPTTEAPVEEPVEEAISALMVTDTGGVNDQSFNQITWTGLERAKEEFGAEVSYIESHQESDYAANLESALDQGNDLIWGVGFMMEDAVFSAAQANPDQKYACVDVAFPESLDNLIGITFKDHESSYLVGYIAGKMTKTNKIGFIGGMEGVVISRFHYGYMAGAKAANPDVEIFEQYAESFGDVAKGKAIANQMYQKGADIVFHAAGGVGIGVIEAAKESDKYAIGVDMDQNHLAPDNVITSAVKKIDNAVVAVLKDLQDGKFPGGTNETYGLKEGGVGIADTTSKLVPQEILDEVKEVEEKIISGDIKVPANIEEYNELVK